MHCVCVCLIGKGNKIFKPTKLRLSALSQDIVQREFCDLHILSRRLYIFFIILTPAVAHIVVYQSHRRLDIQHHCILHLSQFDSQDCCVPLQNLFPGTLSWKQQFCVRMQKCTTLVQDENYKCMHKFKGIILYSKIRILLICLLPGQSRVWILELEASNVSPML